MTTQQPRLSAILLAAGQSTRMGQPKALLSWGSVPLVRHQVDLLGAHPAIDPVIVVVGDLLDEVQALLHDTPARIVVNPLFRDGRATSLAAGARALQGGPTSVLVASVDQPLAANLLDPLVTAWRSDPGALWRPSYQGRGGHPLIVPADVAPELAHVTEAARGLRAVVTRHRHRLRAVPVDTQLAVLNLNTPADYAAASPKLSAGP
ncbi:MAG: nucleotidyltransferase family protein [Chloroflexota bacterium]|nr:nucleotidyltransferase family protein [Chloroflexota bacterium]